MLGFQGLERVPVDEAEAGDIIIISGLDDIGIGVTICDRDNPVGLPMLPVDEPTLTMDFMVNTSPLAGTEGKFVTSRQIRDRLTKELLINVALRVDETGDADVFRVSGRGELHLTILLENMRREGFELAVGKPRVVYKEINGEKCEPYENLSIDLEDDTQGAVMEEIGRRRGELTNMESDGHGRTRLEYHIPARGLIGFQSDFMTMTRGTGLMSHVFDDYGPVKADLPGRHNGVLVSQDNGEAVAYALWKLEDRGRMFVVARRQAVRRHDHRHPQPRQRPGGQPDQGQAADQRARLRHRRSRAPDHADQADAGIRSGIHRRRRTGRNHAEVDPHPQALPAGTRAQAREPRGRLNPLRPCAGAGVA